MTPRHEIRADYDDDTIVVYQAYSNEIAEAALAAGRFVAPFSFNRMTWIKPSFLWMMERSGWARKPGQERVLAVRLSRAGWESALARAVLSHPSAHTTAGDWSERIKSASVVVQWDPERALRGGKLAHRSIQVGLGPLVVRPYVDQWIQELRDETPRVAQMRALLHDGDDARARELLPVERPYPVPAESAMALGMI